MAVEFYVEAFEWRNCPYSPQFPFTPRWVLNNINDLDYKDDIEWYYLFYQINHNSPVQVGWMVRNNDENNIEFSGGLWDYENYDHVNYRFVIAFYKSDRETSLGYVDFDLHVRGHFGTLASTPNNTIPLYPLVNNDLLQVSVMENLSDANPGTILRVGGGGRYDGAFEWYVTCPDGSERTLENAREGGYITDVGQNMNVGAGEGKYNLEIGKTLFFKPKVAGNYSVRCKMTYATHMLYGYYESGIEWTIFTDTVWSDTVAFVAYNPTNAHLEIKTVEAAEDKLNDPNPLNGMPPYKVEWADVSATYDAWQIPQKQVTWEFGDEDSGKLNFASFINTGNTLATPPTQFHSYPSYGPYTCKMTVIDKLDNETTVTAQFTPSTASRMIKPPTLTPLTGNQPLLVEGNAFVAGRPEPEAEWSYRLLNDDSGYYTGEKEGKYVEMSLLAGGEYEIICQIVDISGEVLETNTFTVNVTPDPLYEDNPVPMNNFNVWVYDADGGRVDIMQPAFKARYTDAYAREKSVTFQVPIDYPYIQRLRKDCVFDFGYLGIARRMVVVGYEESDDGLYVTISGQDFVSYVLSYRVATVATRSTSGNGKDIQRCSGEALLRYFAVANLNTEARDVPLLHLIGSNLDRGGAVEYSARYEKTADIIDSICTSSGLGWDTSLQATTPESIGWRVVEGEDRTLSSENPIIFSGRVDGLRNANIGAYHEYTSPNVAIGAGEGNGATRDYSEFGDVSSTGMLRREVFVDAGDKAGAEEVRLTCLAKLKNLEDESLYVYPNADAQWVFGVDYHVGDYVTIETRTGILMDMQIVSAELSYFPEEGERLLLKCGVDERETRTILRELELGNTYSKK